MVDLPVTIECRRVLELTGSSLLNNRNFMGTAVKKYVGALYFASSGRHTLRDDFQFVLEAI